MSIKVDFFGLNDFLTRPILPNNDEETQPPVCGPNETLHGDLMFPEHYSCVPHEPIPDIDPGMNAPRRVPPTDRWYLNPFGFSPPTGDSFGDWIVPTPMPQFPEISPWDAIINEVFSHIMPKVDDLVYRYPPADPFAGMDLSFWNKVFKDTDWNKVYSDMIRQKACEAVVVGILFLIGIQSKI